MQTYAILAFVAVVAADRESFPGMAAGPQSPAGPQVMGNPGMFQQQPMQPFVQAPMPAVPNFAVPGAGPATFAGAQQPQMMGQPMPVGQPGTFDQLNNMIGDSAPGSSAPGKKDGKNGKDDKEDKDGKGPKDGKGLKDAKDAKGPKDAKDSKNKPDAKDKNKPGKDSIPSLDNKAKGGKEDANPKSASADSGASTASFSLAVAAIAIAFSSFQ
ncbi:hypothetical protein EC988_000148 [Linderina pennispora]|nr:hypothetical protein EC988_000148 [Linderina pennispora]